MGESTINRGQREIWRDERARLGLVPGTLEFGRRGLMQRLDGQSVQVVLLPDDPLAVGVDFDAAEDLLRELPGRFEGTVARSVQLLHHDTADADHLIREQPGDAGARGLLALARHGGTTVGLAEKPGAYVQSGYRTLRLSSVAGAVRLALTAQDAALTYLETHGRWTPEGPWELTVALPGARDSLLGGYAEGWRDADELDTPPQCREDEVLVRVELRAAPRDANDRDEVLRVMLGRVVNAFGTTTAFHMPARGQSGRVDPGY